MMYSLLPAFIIGMMGILIGVLYWELKTLRKKYNKSIKEYTEEVAKWKQ